MPRWSRVNRSCSSFRGRSDLRFNWVCCRLAHLGHGYMTQLVTEAWRMVVPAFLARQRLDDIPGW